MKNRHLILLSGRTGGAITLIAIALFVVSCAGLIYGFINLYIKAEKLEQEKQSIVTEVQITEDPEQAKQIGSMKLSLENSMAENKGLSDKIKKMTDSIAAMQKDIDDKNNQVNYLLSGRTKQESSTKEEISRYEQSVKEIALEKGKVENDLERVKLELKGKEEAMNEKITALQAALAAEEDKRVLLTASLNELRESNLVKETAKMHFNLANHFLKSKDYEAAIKEYKRAIDIKPDDAYAHYNLALIYDVYTEDDLAAMDHYRRCLEIDAKFPKKKEVQERIVNLAVHESVKIAPTQARVDVAHKLSLENVEIPEESYEDTNN